MHASLKKKSSICKAKLLVTCKNILKHIEPYLWKERNLKLFHWSNHIRCVSIDSSAMAPRKDIFLQSYYRRELMTRVRKKIIFKSSQREEIISLECLRKSSIVTLHFDDVYMPFWPCFAASFISP